LAAPGGPANKRGGQTVKKLTISLILATAALTLSVMIALATPPERVEFTDDTPYVVADCGNFEVINYPDYTFQLIFFYDSEGNLERVNQFWFGDDNLTNSVSGSFIRSPFHNHAVFDVNELTVHQGGIFWHVTTPHEGHVFFETGHYIVQDYDQPEPTITFTGASNLDTVALCSLLSG
jgi:hypothetical protein